jgi:hypothetical protein
VDENKTIGNIGLRLSLDIYDLPFNLHNEEKLIAVIRPDKYRFIIKRLTMFYLLMAIFLIPLVFPYFFPQSLYIFGFNISLIKAMPVLVVSICIAAFVLIWLVYSRLTFWLTDKRIISRVGMIGYAIRSLPLEAITDVIIHRGPFDIFLDASNIMLPTINNDIYNLYRHFSGINYIPTLDYSNAVEMQKLIFSIRDTRSTTNEFVYKSIAI